MINSFELKKARMSLKLNQAQLADKLNLTREYVGLLERGEREITPAVASAIELLLIKENNVISYASMDDLLGIIENKTSSNAKAKEDVVKSEHSEAVNSHIETHASQLILQELRVVRELLAWTLAESCKIPEKKILEKIRSTRTEFQEG